MGSVGRVQGQSTVGLSRPQIDFFEAFLSCDSSCGLDRVGHHRAHPGRSPHVHRRHVGSSGRTLHELSPLGCRLDMAVSQN